MSDMTAVVEPARQIPLVGEVDVAVVGGGSAGVMAAIGAARGGARTCLIERFATIGGALSTGIIGHFGNRFRDDQGRPLIGGAPVELLERIMAAGGMPYDDMREAADSGTCLFFSAGQAAQECLRMVVEAGVELWLLNTFAGALPAPGGGWDLIVANKGGRQAIRAREVVDCSGEADVARAVGAPMSINADRSWGLLFEMSHVDVIEFATFLEGAPNDCPEFEPWLAKHLGMSRAKLRGDLYWGEWLDGKRRAWKWRREIMQAVDAGDFDLIRDLPGGGQVRYGWDGFWPEPWHGRDVVSANVCMVTGLEPTDPRNVTAAEVGARTYAADFVRFLRGYIPGFRHASIRAMGGMTMSRGGCEIIGESGLSAAEVMSRGAPRDTICLAGQRAPFGLPLGLFIPRGVEHLLVAGKCAEHGYAIRASVTCMAAGYSCGLLAALACERGVTPGRLKLADRRKLLQAHGVLLKPGRPDPHATPVLWPKLLGVPYSDDEGSLLRLKMLS